MSQKKWQSPIFKKNLFGLNLGNLDPNLPQFMVFGQLFKFESLVVAEKNYSLNH